MKELYSSCLKVIQTNQANWAFINDNFYHTRKNFPDAQKLSGEQCLRALGVFGPLQSISSTIFKSYFNFQNLAM